MTTGDVVWTTLHSNHPRRDKGWLTMSTTNPPPPPNHTDISVWVRKEMMKLIINPFGKVASKKWMSVG